MSVRAVSYVFVGFKVHESDFWSLVPAVTSTCDHGHEQRGDDRFCSQDGTKFTKKHNREASPMFKALAEHFKWSPDGPGQYSWLSGYERIYRNLQSADDYGKEGALGLFTVNRLLPVDRDSVKVWALAKKVAVNENYSPRHDIVFPLNFDYLQDTKKAFEEALRAVGVERPVHFFVSLFVAS